MGWNHCFSAVLFFVLTGLAASSFISDDVFESHGSTGRTLLQAKKACPVNFEFQNYTIITSQCKGPQYPPKLCCGAFKEFACPFVDYLNDLSNDCASTMFSYINLYGKYPPGLFASECREGKLGLACPASPDGTSANVNGGSISLTLSPLLILATAILSLSLAQPEREIERICHRNENLHQKMAWNHCFSAVLFFVLMGLAASSFISDDVFESHGSTGRTLLQIKKDCPVDLEHQNYTIITSKCHGPDYPPKFCCSTFKELVCPFAEYFNDLTNNCASTLFDYLTIYGNYPRGLFSNTCREGKLGLECPAPAPGTSTAADANGGGSISRTLSSLLIPTTAIYLLVLFQMF
ncbi:hypothetical protein BVC80_437g4 [Macleaya cordata]|uniref:GPI-anchored protein LLG1-like domain-containing protein n=1 Tax=Macleaya cordata TaxID=56857 RepID=A0A200PT35_MACCD|nr:hypothetical protein BVC80_437g4 [Macleaya cordata]